MVIIGAPIEKIKDSDCCRLPKGCYTMRVNGMPVVIDPFGRVVADPHAEPTCFDFDKFEKGGVCTFVIYEQGRRRYAEFQNGGLCIFMQHGGPPRNWTIRPGVTPGTFTIAPGPPSQNGWTAPPFPGGQICLEFLQPTVLQEFTLTPCPC
ncbi:hypothetical protein SCLCIDRAFT_1218804 [Scleroderma citrinum Foug A]|uniref:Uncharacterized protein n=1 Tax=Scleroderma citrinum Foug A TaxID=1036808 RepID=A0A0C3A0R7_9AGAM|nr:hypothetical protein SCLCIDRAFT_1218804 [Scleroderma citrinum Foug A]